MAADGRAAQAHALLEEVGDRHADHVANLDGRRKSLKREQQQISTEIRNEHKRRQRLLEKSRGLSDEELLSVISTRAAAKSKAKAKAKAKAKEQSRAN